MSLQILELQPGRQHGMISLAGCIDKKRRQITQVSVPVRPFVDIGVLWIEMTASGEAGDHLAILFHGAATALRMQMGQFKQLVPGALPETGRR